MAEENKNIKARAKNSGKKIIGIVALVGAAFGISKLLSMKKISDNIITKIVNPRVHKVDTSGLTFRTEISLQNPTNGSMTISKPVVYLTSNSSPITNSNIENKEFKIQPQQTTQIDTIEIKLTWLQLAPFIATIITKLPAIISALKNSKSVTEVLGIPLEMFYTLYADKIFIKSEPTKLI